MSLRHDYYIIESLNDKDIKDGKIFYDSLKSIEGFDPIYKKVESFNEFKKAMKEFADSNLQYLFVSAHGDEENIHLVSGDVNAYDLLEMNIRLNKRRVFLSTCKGGSFLFGKYFIKKGAYSVIGAPDNLAQIVAVGMWSTMIVLFERFNNGIINFSELDKTLKLMNKVYEIDLKYYSFVRNKQQMKEYDYSLKSGRTRRDISI